MRRAQLSYGSVVAACGLAVALAGCGSGADPGASLRLDATGDGSLRFERAALLTTAGRASIEMRNPSNIPHAIGIRGKGVDEIGATVGTGGSSRVTPDLGPGAYELFCPVGGHEQAGMTATLTVR